jgi:hypothetical protein
MQRSGKGFWPYIFDQLFTICLSMQQEFGLQLVICADAGGSEKTLLRNIITILTRVNIL